jgi:DNA-binding MarR family transcriptional regulator
MPPSRPCPLYDGTNYVVEDSVGHKLVNLIMLMRRAVDQRMAEHDLTDAQWKPLWFLHSGRAGNAIELAREMDVDAGAVTRLLDRLEAKGLLERVRSQTDRRVVHLQLTPAGRAKAAEVPHVLASVNNDLLRGFSETEFKQVIRLVDRLSGNATLMQAPIEQA